MLDADAARPLCCVRERTEVRLHGRQVAAAHEQAAAIVGMDLNIYATD